MMTFAEWLAEVDAILDSSWGIDHEDIPDADWFSLWRYGVVPGEAAGRSLQNLFAALAEEVSEAAR